MKVGKQKKKLFLLTCVINLQLPVTSVAVLHFLMQFDKKLFALNVGADFSQIQCYILLKTITQFLNWVC